MKTPWTCLITGIGIPLLDRCLQSIQEQEDKPDQIVLALDVMGRRCAGLSAPGPFVEETLARYPDLFLDIAFNDPPDGEWHIANQTITKGLEACKTDLALVLHEDAAFHNPRVAHYLRLDLERMEEAQWQVDGKRIVGVCGPLWSNMSKCWTPGVSGPMVMQEYAGSSTILRRDWWEGNPLNYDGVWYDARWQQALIDSDCWLLCDPRARFVHDDTESLKANAWGAEWKWSPLWGEFGLHYDKAFDRWWARAADRHVPISPYFLGCDPPEKEA